MELILRLIRVFDVLMSVGVKERNGEEVGCRAAVSHYYEYLKWT